MAIALKAENVSIRYITGDFKDIGLKEYTVRRLTHNYHVNEFMAVDGVSFALEQGDMLGIIGSNGAGKSTLLKAVAGIMEPTCGKIMAQGEVAALLELGSGFDGDLTVKENAYLRGAMLGYTKEFMDQTYDQIIDFAELREFEDRPFKQLSSGMKSRLAFSIASLVKPDILILDEVLSVGDGAFQEKSAKKMREIISRGATTILVSHSLNQIRELCNKVLWLDHGRQVAFGDTETICDQYECFLRGECPAQMPGEAQAEPAEAPQTGLVDVAVPDNAERPKWKGLLKRGLVSSILALFCAVLALNIGQRYFTKVQDSRVEITAQEGSGTVVFRGAYVDGNWVSPADHMDGTGSWIYDKDQAVYTATDGTTLTFLMPAGQERTLIFYAGPDAGRAVVNVDGEHIEFDFWNESAVELGLSYQVPRAATPGMARQLHMIALIVFAIVFIFYFALYKKPSVVWEEREIWLDALKVLSAIMIVLIHCSGDIYNNSFHTNGSLWMQGLWANAIPRFAVPCFFMITGALSLTKYYDRQLVEKSVKRVIFPLIFWSILYVLTSHLCEFKTQLNGFMQIPFVNQDGSLWYAYQLIWIYLGLPFWTVLWSKLSIRLRWGFVAFSLVIPGVLTYVEELLNLNVNEYLPFASVNPMVCYVGLLFFGRLLYEFLAEKPAQKMFNIGIASAVTGLLLIILSSAYLSGVVGQSVHTFFSEVRLPAVIYSAGVFLCFGSARNKMERFPVVLKKFIITLSSLSLGIYMSHCLIIFKIMPDTIKFMSISLNRSADLPQLLICVLLYYAICVSLCMVMRCLPMLRKLVT